MRIWEKCVPLVVAAALMMLCVSAASAAPTGSCKRDPATPSRYECQFYTAGNGITAGSPVVDVHGSRIGYLNGGTNFVDCQEQGSEYPSASASVRNDWWAWTEANDGRWGWVSAYWASGGANNEKFSAVPACPGSMGSAPIVGVSPTPAPTPPSSPKPVPCSAAGGHWYCNFWPAGNGISGGAVVTDGSGYWVGYLNHGRNFVDCQEYGGKVALGGNYNHYWAWTEANDGKWGWVSALFAAGGDNDGTFAGVPSCDVRRDAPPTAMRSTGPAKRAPDPTRCSSTGAGTARITFREYEQHYQQNESSGPGGLGPRYDLEKPGYHTFGGLTIAADTCHGPKGWHLGRTVSVSESSVGLYPGADDSPAVRGSGGTQGWGIALQSYKNGVLTVQALACAKTTHVSWWSIAKKIVGLIPPIPGTPLIIARAKYVVGLIPVKANTYTTHCADLGTDRLHLTAVSQHHVRVTSHGSDAAMSGLFEDHRDHDGNEIRHVIYQRTIQSPIIK